MKYQPIFSIAHMTLREGVRNKIFYNIVLFGLLIIASSLVLNKMTVGDETKVIKDLGLTCISLFGLLTILVLGTNHLYHEFEEKIIYTVLVKPIVRRHYLVGKYLGMLSIVVIQSAAMYVLMEILLCALKGMVSWMLLKAVYSLLLELSLLCSLAILFTTFMRPQLSIITILAVYLIGHSISEVRMLVAEEGSRFAQGMIEIVYYLFPNFDHFDISSQVVHNLPLAPFYLTLVTVYGVFYTMIVLMVSAQIFSRKEF